jgi:hypothetical protein
MTALALRHEPPIYNGSHIEEKRNARHHESCGSEC